MTLLNLFIVAAGWFVCGAVGVVLLRPWMLDDEGTLRLALYAGPCLLLIAVVVWVQHGLLAVTKRVLSWRAGR